MTRRFEQSTRQHTEKFGRRIDRDIKRLATDFLFSIFGTIFPTGLPSLISNCSSTGAFM